MKGPVGTGLPACSQPESKPSWAEKTNLLSFSCQKDLCFLVNFSISSIFSSEFLFVSSKLFQVCRGRVVFCGGKIPCGRVWCKLGELGASCEEGGRLVGWWCKPGSDQARSPGMHRPGASIPPSILPPPVSVNLQHHSCHCPYHS